MNCKKKIFKTITLLSVLMVLLFMSSACQSKKQEYPFKGIKTGMTLKEAQLLYTFEYDEQWYICQEVEAFDVQGELRLALTDDDLIYVVYWKWTKDIPLNEKEDIFDGAFTTMQSLYGKEYEKRLAGVNGVQKEEFGYSYVWSLDDEREVGISDLPAFFSSDALETISYKDTDTGLWK